MNRPTFTLTFFLIGLFALPSLVACAETDRFDGRWRAGYTTAPDAIYEMEFSGDRFHAVQGDAWYRGALVIDPDAVPARIDFVIQECDCGFLGKTSEGIFRWDGDVIELRAPQPGDPRPTEFDEESGETMRLVRTDERQAG